MAYSTERLEKARRLFPSQSNITSRSEDSYSLRTRSISVNLTSWIENDKNDSDYSPLQNRRSKRPIRSDNASRSRGRPKKRARGQSPSLTSFEDADDNMDEASSSLFESSDEPSPKDFETFWQPETERDPNQAYHLRPRKNSQVSTTTTLGRKANKKEKSVQSYHPGSCLACQEIGLDCTIADDPFKYPCNNCRDDECDCILVPSPKWKRVCEPCKQRRRTGCSYASGDYDHSQPCWECQQHGFSCFAGPSRYPPPKIHPGETEGPSTSDQHGEDEFQETPVRDVQSRAKGKTPIVHSAADPSSWYTSEDDTEESHGTAAKTVIASPGDEGNQITPALSSPNIPTFDSWNSNPYGTIYRLRTFYPHPLTVLDKNSRLSCHWCSNFAYGIVGLGERKPQVLDFENGRLVELEDGHLAEGKEPSRMCWYCAYARVRIMQCCHNRIEPMMWQANLSAAYEDLVRARAALQDPHSGYFGAPFPESKHAWCSLCQEPASWSCESILVPRVEGVHDPRVVDPVYTGCGLFLCGYCARTVRAFRGDLDQAVTRGNRDINNGTEYRADVDYILRDPKKNHLRRNVGL
ncbi:hypothetical protein POX_d06097 [Penicillium oxalicum]|uniref:hypothetical protein n=1 Tax=Penicillium oxalicum TaxID=69781 RepID=UPI0020B693D6|nr:hypothetical protein POX_d06097 [Penicillium oxalicum]KAI2790576.1 hypothetical protein POX_d06097 [Penicillium oxalicum]